ncbi:hypothetical protein Back2_25800 [Nocardioides baekrokdamisoli]|uniref:histidine kinase n=1 Tax=Nocardioides baekrokdamisoli TaxID=1804624 RepID=A0A3G9J0Y2_9ACTN|nr:histidine kinase [Nocardioides baekrokdamisoli]BBH18293.1 hypothetical protein Back2_25800 [Nocardioides baekrokdamisoli]
MEASLSLTGVGPLSLTQRRVAAGARILCLIALAVPLILATTSRQQIAAYVALILLWGLTTPIEALAGPAMRAALSYDSFAVGIIAAICIGHADNALIMLVVPPLVRGLYHRIPGAAVALALELIGCGLTLILIRQHLDRPDVVHLVSWGVASVGAGLIGSMLSRPLSVQADPMAPYRAVSALLDEVTTISTNYGAGLDVATAGATVVASVTSSLNAVEVAVYAPAGGAMRLVAGAPGGQTDWLDLARSATDGAVARGSLVAFPLVKARPAAGVVVARVVADAPDKVITRRLLEELAPYAMQLEAAVAFSNLATVATSAERERLSREMHDGLAQDIAGLGYLVDAVAAGTTDPKQQARVAMLRSRVTEIVSEVRSTLTSLRTSIIEGDSLGTALGAVSRRLADTTDAAINVLLDEGSERLLPAVENEIFRIGQEALGNAVKHAHATVIEVECIVHAPDAMVSVTDNGRGLGSGRDGSYGLTIMHERAKLIGATLTVEEQPGGGVCVRVQVGRAYLP